MSFTSRVWEYDPSVDPRFVHEPHFPINIEACRRRDLTIRYAIRQSGCCLNKQGEWEYEPIPSSRDDQFFDRCRYDTWEQAAKQIIKHCEPWGRVQNNAKEQPTIG